LLILLAIHHPRKIVLLWIVP